MLHTYLLGMKQASILGTFLAHVHVALCSVHADAIFWRWKPPKMEENFFCLLAGRVNEHDDTMRGTFMLSPQVLSHMKLRNLTGLHDQL